MYSDLVKAALAAVPHLRESKDPEAWKLADTLIKETKEPMVAIDYYEEQRGRVLQKPKTHQLAYAISVFATLEAKALEVDEPDLIETYCIGLRGLVQNLTARMSPKAANLATELAAAMAASIVKKNLRSAK